MNTTLAPADSDPPLLDITRLSVEASASTSHWLHLLTPLATFSLTVLVARVLILLQSKRGFARFASAAGCQPVPVASNPTPMPWSLNRKYEVYKASVRGDLFEGHFTRKYAKHGKTHAIVSPITGRQKGINTIEPANIQAVLATRFDDYKRPEFRSLAAQPMLLPGLFTTDGPVWAHWRGMVKPQFTRKRFDTNVANSERHMQLIFAALGPFDTNGWSGDVDLLEPMYRLTMDTATQFLFGSSAETQTAALARSGKIPKSAYRPSALDGFDHTFLAAGSYVGHRIKLSNMYWVYDGFGFRRACKDLYRMVDAYVTEVRLLCAQRKAAPGSDTGATNVIEEMEMQGASQKDIVEQTMHLLVAGMDTSAAALGWTFSMLASHPQIYAELRRAVLTHFGTGKSQHTEFNLETLKGCTYLQWCILETLRLFPAGPINVREATRDTLLPTGGGCDGKAPVAVQKGTRVQLGTYLTHRRTDIWGEDAAEYRPGRWQGRRRGWEFTPFSGGPQTCVGQGYSISQISFAIARMVQRFDRIEEVDGSDNAKRSWMTVLTPGAGVRVRLHIASDGMD